MQTPMSAHFYVIGNCDFLLHKTLCFGLPIDKLMQVNYNSSCQLTKYRTTQTVRKQKSGKEKRHG